MTTPTPGGDVAGGLLGSLSPEARAQYDQDVAGLSTGGVEQEYVPWYGPGLGRGRDIESRAPGQRVKRKKPRGLLTEGNVDPDSAPVVPSPDGTVSTPRTISIKEDGVEVLIPTVTQDGRVLTDEEAIEQYHRTGRHMGKFDSVESADAYAEEVQGDQEASTNWDDTVAGAKGQKVHPDKSAPIPEGMGYAEMSEEEAFGGGDMPLTPQQTASQARRDKQAEGSPDSEIWKDANEVLFDPYNWAPDDLSQVGKQMQDVGLLDEIYNMPDFLTAWKQLVGQSVVYNKARPGTLATPLDMLDINYGDPANRNEIKGEREAKKQLTEPYRWTPAQRGDITQRMEATGLLPDNYTNKDVADVWGQLVGQSLEYNKSRPGEAPVDPKAMIDINYANPENLELVNKKRASKDALEEPYRWEPGKYDQVTNMMLDAGLIDEDFTSRDVAKAWAGLVEESMAYDEARSGPPQRGGPGPGGPPPPPGYGLGARMGPPQFR